VACLGPGTPFPDWGHYWHLESVALLTKLATCGSVAKGFDFVQERLVTNASTFEQWKLKEPSQPNKIGADFVL
jgi:hypothetical protein